METQEARCRTYVTERGYSSRIVHCGPTSPFSDDLLDSHVTHPVRPVL